MQRTPTRLQDVFGLAFVSLTAASSRTEDHEPFFFDHLDLIWGHAFGVAEQFTYAIWRSLRRSAYGSEVVIHGVELSHVRHSGNVVFQWVLYFSEQSFLIIFQVRPCDKQVGPKFVGCYFGCAFKRFLVALTFIAFQEIVSGNPCLVVGHLTK